MKTLQQKDQQATRLIAMADEKVKQAIDTSNMDMFHKHYMRAMNLISYRLRLFKAELTQ